MTLGIDFKKSLLSGELLSLASPLNIYIVIPVIFRHMAGGDRSESTSSGQPTNYAEYKAIGVKRCLHMQWG